MTDDEFRAWLAKDNEVRCVLVELDYIYESTDSPTGPTTGTLYFSDREFFDDVTDHVYVDVVKAAPQYARALSGDELGSYISSVGSLELDNADGELDFTLSLACDGSQIRFYYGGQKWPVADFRHIFTAIVSKVSAPSFDRISVSLKDTGLLLNKSIGGTSTVGGTGPNADRSRPVNFGYIHNLAGLVADEALLIYVHSDSGTGTVAQEVRDRGVSVSFTDNADGTFTLNASPDGTITVDVLAEPLGSDKVLVSDAMDYLIGTRAGLSALSLYDGAGPTFTVSDIDDYKLGVSLPEARNVIDALADIIQSGNCFWAVKRTGEFTFGRLRLNDIGSFTENSPPSLIEVKIYEDDIDQGTFKLDHAPTGYYRYQAFMSRNWSRQTDFATSLTPDEQAVYSRAGLYLMQPDSVGTTYAAAPELYHKTLAISPVIDTLLSEVFSVSDLDSLAQWETTRRAMFLPWIEVITIVVGIDFYELELGDAVRLFIAPRMGEDDTGVLFQVIGITIRLTDAKIELRIARRNVIQEIPANWTRAVALIDSSQPEYVAKKIGPIDLTPGGIIDHGGSGGGGWGFDGYSYKSGGGGVVIMKAGILYGGELLLTSIAMYNHAAGSSKGTRISNGVEIAETGFIQGSHFGGVTISSSANGSPPMSGTISAGTAPSSNSGTHSHTFVFIADVNNIIDIDFNASRYAQSAGSVTSTMTVEVKLRDDTSSTTALDWLPNGAGGGMTGGTSVLDPFTLNGTMPGGALTSGTFQCETPVLVAGHSYTLTITISVVNTVP